MISFGAKILILVTIFSSYLVNNQSWGWAENANNVDFSFVNQHPTAIAYSSLFFALWGVIAALLALMMLSLLIGYPDPKSTISPDADDEYEQQIAYYMSGIGIWSAAYLVFLGHGMYGFGFLTECLYLLCAHNLYFYARTRTQTVLSHLVSSCVYALAFWSFTNMGILYFGLDAPTSLAIYAAENIYLLWLAWKQRDYYIAINVAYIWLGIYLKSNDILE